MLEKLTDRVYYLPHEDIGDRPTLGYIRGDRYVLMVDAGNSAAHVADYNGALTALALPAPDFIALTHWHWDHTFGLHAVPCPAIAQTQTNTYIREMQQWAWDDASMQRRLATGEDTPGCDQDIRLVYPDRNQITLRTADITFADVLTLDLGGITCELLHVDNPHTADGTLVYVPQEGVLFLGDADCQGNHHGRAPLYKEKLAAYIVTLENMSFTTCLHGHEMPMQRADYLGMLKEELATL